MNIEKEGFSFIELFSSLVFTIAALVLHVLARDWARLSELTNLFFYMFIVGGFISSWVAYVIWRRNHPRPEHHDLVPNHWQHDQL